jgi:hypothetical protein
MEISKLGNQLAKDKRVLKEVYIKLYEEIENKRKENTRKE